MPSAQRPVPGLSGGAAKAAALEVSVERKQASQVTTGALVVAVGLILLGNQLHWGWAWDFGRLWPIVFFVLGIGRLVSASEDGRWGSAFWFLFLGTIFMLHTYRVLRLHDSWPLFVVAGGVSLLFPKRSALPTGSSAPDPASTDPAGKDR